MKNNSLFLKSGCLILCFVFILVSLLSCSADKGDDSDDCLVVNYESDWSIISHKDSLVVKEAPSVDSSKYTMIMDYSELPESEGFSPAHDLFTELFAEWALSLCSFDYSLHFSLFEEGFLDYVYGEFDKAGLSREDAIAKVEAIARDIFGVDLDNARVELSVKGRRLDLPEDLEAFRLREATRFAEAGLDVANVKGIAVYNFDDTKVYYDGGFFLDLGADYSISEFVFFLYGEKWYVEPSYIEDDLCVELVHDTREQGEKFYKLDTADGVISSIEGGYLCLDEGDRYYFSKDGFGDFKVGDAVTIEHYSNMNFKRSGLDGRCYIAVVTSISEYSEERYEVME